MADLTDNEILSILNKMDAEQRFFEQMTTARRQIRAVIERYQAIQAALPALASEHSHLQDALAGLRAEYERRRQQGEADLTASYARLTADLEAKVAPLQQTVAEWEAKAREAERAAQGQIETTTARLRDLERQVTEQTEALARVSADFQQFRTAHGLA
jgi:molecular chaperone GrpE (heat shock protein)